jgi:hypothetical protein
MGPDSKLMRLDLKLRRSDSELVKPSPRSMVAKAVIARKEVSRVGELVKVSPMLGLGGQAAGGADRRRGGFEGWDWPDAADMGRNV